MNTLPPIADPFDGDGLGSYDTDELDALERASRLQVPSCDRCTQGVMDATNSHLLGLCRCSCHG